jgi:outer membrane protein assembly factor BamB
MREDGACALTGIEAGRPSGCLDPDYSRGRGMPPGLLMFLFLVSLPQPALAQDSVLVHCTVYHDENGNGLRDTGEPGLSGVRVTNGRAVSTTDESGATDVWVNRSSYRFATLTVPAGMWPTTPFYHRVSEETAGPDTTSFGLRTHPATAADPVRWVHITDTHVCEPGAPWQMNEALAQINDLPDPSACVFNTGDLVDAGWITEQWDNYVCQAAASELPLLHVVGNHDVLQLNPPLQNYEAYVGPPYYSLEMGTWHYIVWNSESGSPNQPEWISEDVANAPVDSHFALLQHRMSTAAPDSVQALWRSLGIRDVFSGHWHCLQFNSRSSGFHDYNLSWTILGPIDRTPRVFGIVTCKGDGSVFYDLRRLAVNHRVRIVSPADEELVPGDSLLVLVQSYDTSAHTLSLSVGVSGPGGNIPPTPLSPEGISLWRRTLDVSGLADGAYTLTAAGSFEDGWPIATSSPFAIERAAQPAPELGEDWPMFRKCAAGSSFVAKPLELPLRLRWATAVPGMIALNSPVVAGGSVYLGFRPESRVQDAGIVSCDALTGEIHWLTPIPGGVALAPAVAGDVVIVTALADSIYGLDADSGARLWSLGRGRLGGYDLTAPVFEGPLAWVGGEPHSYEIEWATGQVHWQSEWLGTPFYPYIYSAPAVGKDLVYYGLFGFSFDAGSRSFCGLKRGTGLAAFWETHGAWRSPVCAQDTIYVVGGLTDVPYYPLQRVGARSWDGNILWTALQDVRRETASPALAHGVLVVSGKEYNRDGMIGGFRAADGELLWSFPVGECVYEMIAGLRKAKSTSSTPAIADSVVFVGSLDGHLYALDLADGALLWSYDLATPIASSPAISGDFLFVGASDGHLYAFTSAAADTATDASVANRHSPGFVFSPPFPSPGRQDTQFRWQLPKREHVRLRIYDIRGRLVRALVDEALAAGSHHARWDGRDDDGQQVAAGVYFARLQAGLWSEVRKCIRLSGGRASPASPTGSERFYASP